MMNNRIQQLIDTLYSGNKSAFARSIGVSPSVIGNMTGERGGSPSFDVLEKIIYTNASVSIEWLMTGQGTMLKPNTSQPEATKTPTKLSTTVKEDNTLLNHLQKENKELKAEINSLNKQIGKLEGKLESAYELMEDLKKENPAPGLFRAAVK